MYDNKIRLSQDVLEKAELIAQEWGLKNARAAVEAVFRKYADEYLNRQPGATGGLGGSGEAAPLTPAKSESASPASSAALRSTPIPTAKSAEPPPEPPVTANDALSELDELLGL